MRAQKRNPARRDHGEPIAVAGEFDREIYAPADRESHLIRKIMADAILSAQWAKPKAKEKIKARKETPAPRANAPPAPRFWDRGER
jgi:hypothetical protein